MLGGAGAACRGIGSFTGQEVHLSFAAPGAKEAGRMVVADGIHWRKDSGQSIRM